MDRHSCLFPSSFSTENLFLIFLEEKKEKRKGE